MGTFGSGRQLGSTTDGGRAARSGQRQTLRRGGVVSDLGGTRRGGNTRSVPEAETRLAHLGRPNPRLNTDHRIISPGLRSALLRLWNLWPTVGPMEIRSREQPGSPGAPSRGAARPETERVAALPAREPLRGSMVVASRCRRSRRYAPLETEITVPTTAARLAALNPSRNHAPTMPHDTPTPQRQHRHRHRHRHPKHRNMHSPKETRAQTQHHTRKHPRIHTAPNKFPIIVVPQHN
ncbi:hypothetical protein J2X34_000928 [Rhodococcus sp. BE178]